MYIKHETIKKKNKNIFELLFNLNLLLNKIKEIKNPLNITTNKFIVPLDECLFSKSNVYIIRNNVDVFAVAYDLRYILSIIENK